MAGYLERVFNATEEANRRAILAALPEGRGGALLDLGTHDGSFTVRVAERLGADSAHGVEYLSEHAEAARARGIEVALGDLDEGLPYPDATFQTIHSNQVIEHLRRPDRFLSEIRRVLAPGGLACLSTNNLASWHNVLSLALGYQPPPAHVSDEVIVGNPLFFNDGRAHVDKGRVHLRLFTGPALGQLCAHHGLATRSLKTVGYYPLPPRLAQLATSLDRRHGAFLVGTFVPAP